MKKLLRWYRSEDGHGSTHCGFYSFGANYCGATTPQDYQLWFLGDPEVRIGNMIATQAECKERAEEHARGCS